MSSSRSKRIRIGLLTPTLLFGGAERWVATLARGLHSDTCEVVGVGVRDMGSMFDGIASSIPCTVVDGRYALEWVAARSNVLIVWGLTSLTPVAWFKGPIIYVSHGACEWTRTSIRACANRTTHRVAVSRIAAKMFEAPFVKVLHNGIDVDRCTTTKTRAEARAELGLADGDIAIGYLGRLSAEKNPLACVEAAAELGPPFRAVVVGGGPNAKTFADTARSILPNTILRPAVNNVGDVYKALDCFVLASPAEGFSMALAEAWYCGVPTVSTPVGAVELEEMHGQLTVTVPISPSPRELADGVCASLQPSNREVVERAQRVVAEHYTDVAMCSRWIAYLEEIMPIRTVTGCECKEPGWCERHKCIKTPRWWELCQTRPEYFALWESGRGPGQFAVQQLAESRQPPKGVGSHLHDLLAKFGIYDRPGCKCKSHAAQMDMWGPDKCLERMETIIGWMKGEAHARHLPFNSWAAEKLVRIAVKRARKSLGTHG